TADALCVECALGAAPVLRRFALLRYGAKSWNKQRRVVARLEATPLGLDIRYVVTSLPGTVQHLYEIVYCGRGQAENFIKLHKAQLALTGPHAAIPRPTSSIPPPIGCCTPCAPRAPKCSALARAEFQILRLRLLKIAARVFEGAARIRVWLPTSC